MPVSAPPADVVVTTGLVRRLLRDQHPDLAGLPLRRLGTGWDNVVLRLGRELTVRVPRRQLGAALVGTELRWLPHLAPRLPIAVPEPVRAGPPAVGYPYPWAVCRFVAGRPVAADPLVGRAGLAAAEALAGVLVALHEPAPADAPRNPLRGVPLEQRTEPFARAVAELPSGLRGPAERVWAQVVDLPGGTGPARWLHGDLHGLNVLVVRNRISGVIDWGDVCAGDPATDLACGWLMLDRAGRERLRALVAVDEDTWQRGRGWALYLSVMFLAHSAGAPVHHELGRRGLAEVLAPR